MKEALEQLINTAKENEVLWELSQKQVQAEIENALFWGELFLGVAFVSFVVALFWVSYWVAQKRWHNKSVDPTVFVVALIVILFFGVLGAIAYTDYKNISSNYETEILIIYIQKLGK